MGVTVLDWVAGDIVLFGSGFNAPPRAIASPGSLTDDSWHYISGVLDAATAQLYLDGAALAMRVSTPGVVPADTVTASIGGVAGNLADGTIDEVRVSSMVRSADWIVTEYNNQSAPSSFAAIGSEAVL
jgi:hypothetical protein